MSKNVPEIRINGFEDSWEEFELGKLGSLKNGMNFDKEAMGKGYPFVNLQNIFGKNIVDIDKLGLAMASNSQLKDYNLIEGDVLFVRSSVKLEGVGEAAVVPQTLENTTYSGFIIRFRDEKGLSKKFKQFVFSTDNVRKQIMSQATDSANKNISQSVLLDLKIYLPSFNEQDQIGNYFERIDNLITLHQQEYEKLVNNKKSMLEKMFPKEGCDVPEIRFKGFEKPWKKCELADFGKATGGTSIESEFSEEGIFKVISIGSYSEDNIYREQGLRAIESEKTKIRILNKGDITMILNDKTASGNIIGRVLLIDEDNTYVYNQRTERIEITNEDYDSLFIYQMLNAPKIREKIIKQSQGNTQIYVNWTTISKTEYWVPCIEEQQKIGEYFAKFDELIMNHQQELEKLKNIKAALLEKMFV